MNIVTNLSANQPNSNFMGAKSRACKNFSKTAKHTLKDKFNGRAQRKPFVYTYDKLVKECEKKEQQAAKQNLTTKAFDLFRLLLNKTETDKKTCCDFNKIRAQMVLDAEQKMKEKMELEANQNLYSKIIERCFKDIDNAVISGAEQNEIDRLSNILDIFVTKFGHFAK